MSIIFCRECHEEVSSKANKCPSCGIKTPSKTKYVTDKIGEAFGGFVVLVIIVVIAGNYSGSSNEAKCKLLNRSLEPDIFLINGESDAGFRYNIQVQNIGERGELTLYVKVSTSEGEFKRKQTLTFESQSVMNLSYSFHEPSVNVTNIQGSVSCKK